MKSSSPRPIDTDPNRTLQPAGFPALPETWGSTWETVTASDGKAKLFAVLHRAEPWKRGRALLIVHGMGEHGGRYLHFPHYLKNEVDAVYTYDHRGHGRSEGLRGHIERFDLFAEDAAAVIRHLDARLRDEFDQSEIHVLGHSLGGHIVLRALSLNPDLPVRSATVSAPFLAIAAKVPAVKRAASLALSRIWGSMQLHTELDASAISRDPAVIEAYRQDRLVHDRITPQLFESMVATMKDTLKRKHSIRTPIQFLIPQQDRIADSIVSAKFAEALPVDDKRIKLYPEFFHEPFNELGKEQAFEDLTTWIHEHHPLVRNA